MPGLEVADDVTAEHRRGSRFIFVIRPFCPIRLASKNFRQRQL